MWLMLAVLALPLIEIALFVVIGGAIGVWPTLAWVVLTAVLGVVILKRVARLGAISFDRDVKALRDPMSPVAGRALTIVAAGLLILPGFFTDTLGLLLLLPPVQGLLIGYFARRVGASASVRAGGMTIEGDWSEVSDGTDRPTAGADPTKPPSGWTRH